jgi:hypothetical protein
MRGAIISIHRWYPRLSLWMVVATESFTPVSEVVKSQRTLVHLEHLGVTPLPPAPMRPRRLEVSGSRTLVGPCGYSRGRTSSQLNMFFDR